MPAAIAELSLKNIKLVRMWYNGAMSREKRILVTTTAMGRDEREFLDGLLSYAQSKSLPRWQIELNFGAIDCCPIKVNPSDYDGFIDIIHSPEQRALARSRKGPTVRIENAFSPSSTVPGENIVTLASDHLSEGRAAADYFLARHFRNFAWYGDETTTDWSWERRKGFVGRLKEEGFACAEFKGDANELPNWLGSLPKPCAIYTLYDMRARRLIDAASRAGFDVPRDLAVLGNDNDRIVCTTSLPSISSIETSQRTFGYNAGRVLNELMRGICRGGRLIKVRHTHVVSRLSTDVDALGDPAIAAALTYVRNHLPDHIDLPLLARKVSRSKHALQERALQQLGHPIGEEIRRIRLNAAKDMLSETDVPIAGVAEACGYNSVSHLSLRIKEACGLTPLAYRRKFNPYGRDTASLAG